MQEREMLFRGKRKDNGEWVYGYYVHIPCGRYSRDEHLIQTIKENGTIGLLHEIIPETLGRYTGLTDKNNKKIFEGDILKCNDNPKDLVKAVFGEFVVIDLETERKIDTVIGWHYEVIPTDELSKTEPFCFAMPLTTRYIECCSMVVIGNIHDNQEILKEKEQ